MIAIIVNFTEQELSESDSIETKYEQLLEKQTALINSLRPDLEPNTDPLFEIINPDDNPEEWEQALNHEYEMLDEWEKAGSDEWRTARSNYASLFSCLYEERAELFSRAEQRQFNELGGDPIAIFEDGQEQAVALIASTYKYHREYEKGYQSFLAYDVVSLRNGRWKLDAAQTRQKIKDGLHLHFDALKDNQELTNQLNAYIIDIVGKSPYVAKEGAKGRGEFVEIKTRENKERNAKHVDTITAFNLRSKLPERYIAPNTKLANEMTKDFLGTGSYEISVSRRKGISIYASMDYDPEKIPLQGTQVLTPFDRVVINGVCTVYVAGNMFFTPEMVYRAMTGRTKTECVSPQSIGAVTKSIEKCRRIMTEIDFTAEAKARNKELSNAQVSDMLLSLKEIRVTVSGVTKKAYGFNSEPIIYSYSKQVGQIISVDIGLLDTTGKNSNTTDEIIVLRDYLLRRIEGMKHKNNSLCSNNILYETIYDEIQVKKPPTRDKAKKIRDNTKSILNSWKGKEYINNYMEYKEGNTIKGLTINY